MELLIAVALLSTLAAVAVVAMSQILTASRDTATMRNAQQFCDTYQAARAAGAEFTSITIDELFEELSIGVQGKGIWAGVEFRLAIAPANRPAVRRQCHYDAPSRTLVRH